MRGLAITLRGLEWAAGLEVKEIAGSESSAGQGCVVFSFKKYEELANLCYAGQSLGNVLLLLGEFSFDGKEDFFRKLEEMVYNADFGEFLDKKTSFRATCKKIGNVEMGSDEINRKAGEFVIGAVKKKMRYAQKVDLDNPDVSFFTYVTDKKAYFGVDFTGFALDKRQHKIFQHPAGLKATIAYSMLRAADLKEGSVVLDPFCGAGTIPIEAALFMAGFPVNYFNKEKFAFLRLKFFKEKEAEKIFSGIDKKIKKKIKGKVIGFDYLLKHVLAAKKNAKIAGIDKLISFSRVAVDWVELKVKENSVDLIVTDVPQLGKNSDVKEIEEAYKQLFHQADFVLKKDGRIAVVVNKKEMMLNAAAKFDYETEKEFLVENGNDSKSLIVFRKKTI